MISVEVTADGGVVVDGGGSLICGVLYCSEIIIILNLFFCKGCETKINNIC